MYVSPSTDQLPHEPRRLRPRAGIFAVRVLLTGALTAALWLLTAGFWPVFALGVLVSGWPPHLARPGAVGRYLRLAWTVRPPEPGLAPLSRVFVSVLLLRGAALVPVLGLAWFLDELLYGRELAANPVEEPVFLLSAARSGSTQISRYLEEDPRLVAPTVAQCVFPYLWLWRLVAGTVGPLVPRSWVERMLEAMTTEEFIERHELSAFHTDTLEVMFYVNKLNMLAFCLGPEVIVSDFCGAHASAHSRDFWEQDFVNYVDGLGRRALSFSRGPGAPEVATPAGRLYLKGHFQAADDAVAARYPDAHFLTVIRDPVRRLPSVLNHLHGNPACEPLGAVPWAWLAEGVPEDEAAYCDREMVWFSRPDGPKRTVIRFREYVADLEGTMTRLYSDCFGPGELPDHVPREHAPRERRNYRVDRSLQELGIDPTAYGDRLGEFRRWCQESRQ